MKREKNKGFIKKGKKPFQVIISLEMTCLENLKTATLKFKYLVKNSPRHLDLKWDNGNSD